jgi:molecular chaperone HtpG
VVDSSDLPLNVSREMIQQDRHIRQMRQWLTRKILDHLAKMKREDEEMYQRLWAEFSQLIKEGVASDDDNRARILPLLLFPSSDGGQELTDLAGYVERMGEDQFEIFYLTGESREMVEASPHLEGLRAQGLEVLYLADPIDEFVVQAVSEFEGHAIKSAAMASPDTSEEKEDGEESEAASQDVDLSSLLVALQVPLQDSVREVRVSSRLTDSPACLVGEEHDMSPQLERILRQTRGEGAVPAQKRILEINPGHELVRGLVDRLGDGEKTTVERYATLLYDYALLAEGSELPDAAGFRHRFGDLLVSSLGSEPSAEVSDSEE